MRVGKRALVLAVLPWLSGVTARSPACAEDRTAVAAPADSGQPAGTSADAKQVWVRQVTGRIQASRARHSAKVRFDGRALIAFTVGWDGHLLDSHISSSSGHVALDSEALAILREAAPFPPAPSVLGSDKVALTLPIRFVKTLPASRDVPKHHE